MWVAYNPSGNKSCIVYIGNTAITAKRNAPCIAYIGNTAITAKRNAQRDHKIIGSWNDNVTWKLLESEGWIVSEIKGV